MTSITTMNTSSSISMTSFDFLNNFINPAREAAGEAVVRNNRFMDKVMDELDICTKSVKVFKPLMGRPFNYVDLSYDQMMMVGMRESKAVRKAVLAQLKALTAENKILVGGMKAIQVSTDHSEALSIADEVMGRRELLRKSFTTEVVHTITQSFENGTSEGGRTVAMAVMNHSKLISLIATGKTPCVFKKEHDGMNPRDFASHTSNLEMISALERAEAKVLALSEAGMSYSEIKNLLIKD